jgi:protocatechuate 3,4-dioxygenase beta subunit
MKTSNHAFHIRIHRRRLLQSLLLTTGGLITSSLYAEALTLTPRCTEGPYYPDHLPLEQDNDLIQIEDGKHNAHGIITNFGGRLLNADGRPVGDAVIELWQADDNGCYIHSRGTQRGKERDDAFQGYGKITTNAKGEYRFRTIKPGLYTGRTRHYHVSVRQGNKRLLTTQLFLAGEPGNDRDMVLNGIRDAEQKLSVIREFKPVAKSGKELVATWDIVLGATPGDGERPPPPPEAVAGNNSPSKRLRTRCLAHFHFDS